MEVGVRELRNHLRRHLHRVRDGDEVVVTDRGRAIAPRRTAWRRAAPFAPRRSLATPASWLKRTDCAVQLAAARRAGDPNVVVVAGDSSLLDPASAEGMAVAELP
jgi:antitoxin (DNA-binding transcriptional repressor) of toxin-antitoxin stability system